MVRHCIIYGCPTFCVVSNHLSVPHCAPTCTQCVVHKNLASPLANPSFHCPIPRPLFLLNNKTQNHVLSESHTQYLLPWL